MAVNTGLFIIGHFVEKCSEADVKHNSLSPSQARHTHQVLLIGVPSKGGKVGGRWSLMIRNVGYLLQGI